MCSLVEDWRICWAWGEPRRLWGFLMMSYWSRICMLFELLPDTLLPIFWWELLIDLLEFMSWPPDRSSYPNLLYLENREALFWLEFENVPVMDSLVFWFFFISLILAILSLIAWAFVDIYGLLVCPRLPADLSLAMPGSDVRTACEFWFRETCWFTLAFSWYFLID